MTETWREIAGYPYEVSDLGHVRHLETKHVLKPWPVGAGYLTVGIGFRKRRKRAYVHALVAQAFIGPRPTDRNQINHKDGDKLNNRVSNLEYVTDSENKRHAVVLFGLCGEGKKGTAKLKELEAREVERLFQFGDRIVRRRLIARMFRISIAQVYNIGHGHEWSHLKGEPK